MRGQRHTASVLPLSMCLCWCMTGEYNQGPTGVWDMFSFEVRTHLQALHSCEEEEWLRRCRVFSTHRLLPPHLHLFISFFHNFSPKDPGSCHWFILINSFDIRRSFKCCSYDRMQQQKLAMTCMYCVSQCNRTTGIVLSLQTNRVFTMKKRKYV